MRCVVVDGSRARRDVATAVGEGGAPSSALLVLQGQGPFLGAQLKLVERLEAAGVRWDELHATSSGVAAALFLVALRAGRGRFAVSPALDAACRSCFLGPWRLRAAVALAERDAARAASEIGEAALDAAVVAARVFVYAYDDLGKRCVFRPRSWRGLVDAGLKAGCIPLITNSSETHLDGIAVGGDEIRSRAAELARCGRRADVWATAFPSPGATLLYVCGITPMAGFSAPLRCLQPTDRYASALDVCRRVILAVFLLLRSVTRRGRTSLLLLAGLAAAAVARRRRST